MAQYDNLLATVNNGAGNNGSDLYTNILQEAIFTAQEQSMMLPLTTVYDISGVAGKTIQVPVYPTVSASALTETADITSEADVAPTAVTITASEYGVMSVVTDLMKSSAGRNVAADIGRMLGEAIALKQDQTVTALFTGFSTAIGGTTNELTVELLFEAAARLRAANAPGRLVGVFHPYAMFNLKKVLTQAGYAGTATAISDIGNAALRDGFVARVAGIDLYESTAISTTTGAGTIVSSIGGIFAPQAIGVAVKKGFDIEVQRDASRRADEIVATATWGVAELVDAYGVKLTVDSVVPGTGAGS